MMSAWVLGTLGGLVAASATVLGALPSLFKTRRGFSISTHMSMDFALGMMLAASAFSLIAPAGQQALVRGYGALWLVLSSIVLGGAFIAGLGTWGERFRPAAGPSGRSGAWLFVVAMMLHNLPEGLASGAAMAGLDWQHAFPILGAIALQNLPEGLTTAVSFQALGSTVRVAFFGAVASAAVELVGGVFGGVLLGMVNDVLPYLLAFAGGAMLYVAGQEVRSRWHSLVAQRARLRSVFQLGLGMAFMLIMGQMI